MDANVIAVAVPAAMVLGFFIKRNTKIANGSIPYINFLLSFLGQLLLEISPANAGVFDGAFAHTLGQMLAQSALITILSTGSHSTLKNSWQLMRDSLLAQAQEKAAEAVAKKSQVRP